MNKKELLENVKRKAIAVCAIRYAKDRFDYYVQKSNEIMEAKQVECIIYRFDYQNQALLKDLLTPEERETLKNEFDTELL